jgi:DNA-binding NarL/FixJ family response regulator
MRTTLTLDDDNAIRLERLRKERDASLKEVVNEMIRRGLDAAEPAKKREPFRAAVMDLGMPRFDSPEELKALIRQIDDEEDLRKLGRT